MCKYHEITWYLPLTIYIDNLHVIKWYVDLAFAVNTYLHSHTSIMYKMGKCFVYGSSGGGGINTTSFTKSKLVGVRYALPQVLWTRNFLEAQGYYIKESVLYQDNQITIRLCVNIQGSSSNLTYHINIFYFLLTDWVNSKEVLSEYCPTDDMIANLFSKNLQSSKLIKFRNIIINISD